jgi:hypothetical protein
MVNISKLQHDIVMFYILKLEHSIIKVNILELVHLWAPSPAKQTPSLSFTQLQYIDVTEWDDTPTP